MKLSKNALTVLKARYLLKDERGHVTETPDQLFWRVAHSVAKAEKSYGNIPAHWEKRFADLMSELRFLPNSPTLMNAGKDMGQLAACFVLPVEDSMKSIFGTLRDAALILQSGGGTGFSFSHLRPRSDMVRSTGGIASGPVSFMKIYNTATDVIKQGGARRGANMGILRVDHPDILEFIHLKRTESELENFNISVAVTDAFMRALKKSGSYTIKNPRSGRKVGTLKARDVFNELVKSAWETGDPGMVFIDRINKDNPTPLVGSLESTNPCGEQPLLPYEACILGSINLSLYVQNAGINWESLAEDVRTAVRFLDDCIDVNNYPIEEIARMHQGNRKIGLGIMGWADTLVLLEIPYDTDSALNLAEKVMEFIRTTAHEASAELARERGEFPNFKGSIHDRPGKPPLRNATLTTIAPTGTLATIADCSSGIEPYYALAYRRLVLDTELLEGNKHFMAAAKKVGFYSTELLEKVTRQGDLRGMKDIPPKIKHIFKTAHEISPEWHVKMQAAFQRHTDNAVSKTINLPHSARPKDVERAYMLAYELGCKGITVFRSGTRKRGTLVRISDTD